MANGALVERACVVCGQGSHRTDWIKKSKDGKHVACDNHSDAEIEKAVAALPKPVAVKAAAAPLPNGPSAPAARSVS